MSSGVSFVVKKLDGVKLSEEMEEHDPHSAACLIQMNVSLVKQVYDGVFNSNPTTISKLQWVLKRTGLFTQVGQ